MFGYKVIELNNFTFVGIGFIACLLFQLHEVDVAVSDMLSPTETNCDVACLLYDVTNPRSFEFCARMYMVILFYSVALCH